MEFDEQSVQDYLKEQFQGRKSFLEHIIFPIFGEERFNDGYDAELLDDTSLRDAAEKIGIRSIVTYGQVAIDLGSIQIFDITVTDHVLLARNRVAVQGVIRRILGTFQGAFMIFHYDDTERWDWRFSFCCKGEKEITEAKRFTFLLGPNQSCRTAAQNFVKLAASTSSSESPTMDNIRKAFDVEALSDEFFAKYKDRYEKIVKYITGKCFKKIGGKWKEVSDGVPNEPIYNAFGRDDKAVRDYVKKLLGRIVFLHFLQKKGWLGARRSWADGDREFMLHLYLKSSDEQKDDFLESVLEPLFDKALDVDRASKGDLFDTHVSEIGKVKIPYLNGGLFTRDAADEKTVRLPREFFCEFLVFLSEYNFTIDENDPNDAEVGVDPEMLSRIFENLLEDNKDKGAIYTPKPIVEYMCREALSAYLQTDESEKDHAAIAEFVKTYDGAKLSKKLSERIDRKLKEVKICDPAIGSGAFPMGMLRELYFCRTALEEDLGELRPAEIKRQIIQQNIYGVDIEKGAVDIARLRFWLSLVVDEESPHTLPNLDFKIMQGNSLLESYKGVPLHSLFAGKSVKRKKASQGRFALDAKVSYTQDELALGGDSASKAITALIDEYYSTDNRKGKQRILNAINEQVKGYIKSQINNSDLNAEIDALECQNDKFFLWHTWFADVFEKGGFDIVIGNPPYIKEYTNRKAFDGFRETSPYYIGKMDLWYGFACHGIDLLSNHGILCFIAQNNWTTSAGAKKMRKKIIFDTRILLMVDFNEYMVFGEDNPEGPQIQTMIMMFAKDVAVTEYTYGYKKLQSGSTSSDMKLMLKGGKSNFVEYCTPQISTLHADGQPIPTFAMSDIIRKIEEMGNFHLHEDEIDQGIIGNPDDAFKINDDELGELSEGERMLVHKFHTHTERWVTANSSSNIIYLSAKKKPCFKPSSNPAIMARLEPYKGKLKKRREVLNGRLPWYFMHWPRTETTFSEGPKVVWAARTIGRNFTYTESEFYGSRNLFFMVTERINMKFITGVLNSILFQYYMDKKLKHLGKLLQLDKTQMLLLSFYCPELEKQRPILSNVDRILAAKKGNPEADTSALEKQIDELVFDLYGLEEAEREIIRKSVN